MIDYKKLETMSLGQIYWFLLKTLPPTEYHIKPHICETCYEKYDVLFLDISNLTRKKFYIITDTESLLYGIYEKC